jgi:hypothetical protein
MIKSERNKHGVLCYWDEQLNSSKTKSPLEHIEQINLVSHCQHKYPKEFNLMMHPVNEANIPVQYRAKLNKCGLLKGASDWLVLYPSNGKPYLVIELKRSRKRDSSVSQEQIDFLLNAEYVGAASCIAYGYKAALQVMKEYFK